MALPQLRLVTDPPPSFGAPPLDATRQVFEHWLFMFGRSPARCKLGPTRRAAINAALTLYDVDALLLAIEGMACDPLEGCVDRQRDAMREIEWLLAREARIERWAELGERLRAHAERRRTVPPEVAAPPEAQVDLAAAAAARERLRDMARARRLPQDGG